MTRIAGTQPVRQRLQRLHKPDYLNHIRHQPCLVCGRQEAGVVQAAHIRAGKDIEKGRKGGIGYKPDDSLAIPLCGAGGCAAHLAFDTNQKRYAKQIIHMEIDELTKYARGNYETWQQENSPDDGMDD